MDLFTIKKTSIKTSKVISRRIIKTKIIYSYIDYNDPVFCYNHIIKKECIKITIRDSKIYITITI